MRQMTMALVLAVMCGGVVMASQKQPPSGTIVLNEVNPQLGSAVTFTWTTEHLPGWAEPRIQVICYQDGNVVYGEAGPADQAFLLGGASSPWVNDEPPADRQSPAHCVADLFYWKFHPTQQFNLLASTEFDAAGLP